MNNQSTCPICGHGELTVVTYDDQVQHGGEQLPVRGLEISACPACGSETTTPAQNRRNIARAVDARRTADGLLSGAEIRRVREVLGITQADASALFGGGQNGFSKYERGEVTQSLAMDRLLRLVAAQPMLLDALCFWAGLPPRTVVANHPGYGNARGMALPSEARGASGGMSNQVIVFGPTWRDASRKQRAA